MAATGEPLAADLGATSQHLADLFAAVTERRRIECSYRGTARRLDPYGLVHRHGHWYLVAGQSGAGARVFRVDRMTGVAIGDRPGAFTRPRGLRVADVLAEAPWEAGEDPSEVVVRFDAEVAWWARRRLTTRAHITEEAGGALLARFPVANRDALIGWMIGFEDHAEILEPEELRARMLDHLEGSR